MKPTSRTDARRVARSTLQATALSTANLAVRLAAPAVARLNFNPLATWLFVACLPNGGSTALAKLLSNAAGAARLTPSGEGQWLVPSLCANGSRWDPDLPVNWAQVRRMWLSRVLFRDSPFVVVEKSPPNLCRFDDLLAAFADMPCHSLAMARHPLAVCASWSKRYRPETVVRSWDPDLRGTGIDSDDVLFHESLGRICGRRLEMLREVSRNASLVTTYEQVSSDPAAFLAGLVEHIPLLHDVDPTADLAVKDYPSQSFRNMNAQAVEQLSEVQRDAVLRGLSGHEAAADHFGYQLANADP